MMKCRVYMGLPLFFLILFFLSCEPEKPGEMIVILRLSGVAEEADRSIARGMMLTRESLNATLNGGFFFPGLAEVLDISPGSREISYNLYPGIIQNRGLFFF